MDKRAGWRGRIESGRIVLELPVGPSRRRFKGKRKGGDKLSPPFEGFGQRGIAAAQLLQVIGGRGRVRQRADNVGDNKPPLLIVKDPAHRTFLEKGHLAHLKTFPSSLRSARRSTICVPISHWTILTGKVCGRPASMHKRSYRSIRVHRAVYERVIGS